MFLNNLQSSQESACAGVFFNKVAGPQNCNVIKKGPQDRFFAIKFSEEDLWTAGSETPVHLFKNNFFYRTSPVAASDIFKFPACCFIRKGTPAKTFFCEFCKNF